jgi:CheY-specific phosphatase CheX
MANYIQRFVDITVTVMKDFAGCAVKAGRPYFLDANVDAHDWEISAIIDFSGDANGAVVMSMDKAAVLRITDAMTGSTTHTDIDEDSADVMSEIVNIIAGNVKQEPGLHNVIISLPSVVIGKGHRIRFPGNHARIFCIPFTVFDNDSFCVLVALEFVNNK